MDTDAFIAQGYLKQAISNRYSEEPIRNYIKFMSTLTKKEQEKILALKSTTILLDKINKHQLG